MQVPDDLATAMDARHVRTFFDSLSFTHQKEYAQWILDAKKEDTRQNRISKAIELLKAKVKSR